MTDNVHCTCHLNFLVVNNFEINSEEARDAAQDHDGWRGFVKAIVCCEP